MTTIIYSVGHLSILPFVVFYKDAAAFEGQLGMLAHCFLAMVIRIGDMSTLNNLSEDLRYHTMLFVFRRHTEEQKRPCYCRRGLAIYIYIYRYIHPCLPVCFFWSRPPAPVPDGVLACLLLAVRALLVFSCRLSRICHAWSWSIYVFSQWLHAYLLERIFVSRFVPSQGF